MSDLQVGDIVTPSKEYFNRNGNILEKNKGYIITELVEVDYKLSYKLKSIETGREVGSYGYSGKFLTYYKNPFSKEEELVLKIKYLWEKQDYFKNKLDKSSEMW